MSFVAASVTCQSGVVAVVQIQMALAGMSAAVQAYQARLDALEQMRIPAVEERVQEVSRSSAEVQQQSIASLYQHSELMCLHLDAQQLQLSAIFSFHSDASCSHVATFASYLHT